MNSKFTSIVRIALGLLLVVFGSNKLFHYLPMPVPTGSAGDFMDSLNATGYIFPIVGVFEVFIGILLLIKKWIPFALVLLAPISINILLFHVFLDIPGVAIALLVVALNAVLIYKHWRLYRPLFA
jgi:putative oxidoreductase